MLLISLGSLFHRVGAMMAKAISPYFLLFDLILVLSVQVWMKVVDHESIFSFLRVHKDIEGPCCVMP